MKNAAKKNTEMSKNTLNILIEEPGWKLALPEIEATAEKVFAAVINHMKACEDIDFLRNGHNINVNLSLGNDIEIKNLNREFRNLDKPTNVLSFAAVDDPDFDEILAQSSDLELGDIMIALETMQHESAEQKISLHDHFCHLLTHGLLHLLGFDHQDDEEAEVMENFEIAILRNLNIDNPYKEL